MQGFLLVGAIVAFVVTVVGIGIAHRRAKEDRPPHAGQKENVAERREDIRKALVELKPVTDKEIAKQVEPLFDNLSAAARAADGDRFGNLFDVERMTEEFDALISDATVGKELRRNAQSFKKGMLNGMKTGLIRRANAFEWDTTEIRAIKKLGEVEAVVITRHLSSNGVQKIRWWLTRRTGTWKIYDLENLDVSIRISVIVVSMFQQGLERVPELARSLNLLAESIQDLVQSDFDGAEKKLNEIARVNLPRELDAVRHCTAGMIHLNREKFNDAMRELDRASELRPDMPIIDIGKGSTYLKLRQYDKALKHLTAYRDLLGDDQDVSSQRAVALHWLERFDEALCEYRKTLNFEPRDFDSFHGFIRTLSDNNDLEDVGDRFAKLNDHRSSFDELAEEVDRRPFDALLQKLVDAMREIDPNYAPVDFYASLVKARLRQFPEAVKLFQSAISRQSNGEIRKSYSDRFSKALISAGQFEEAYAVMPNGVEAFATLLRDAVKTYRHYQLKPLMAAHAKKHPKDPLLPWCQAQIELDDGQYAQADKTFTVALAHPPDGEMLKLFNASRITAKFHTGQTLTAYREIGTRSEAFRQLANLCQIDENYDQLQLLIDAHAQTDPDSPDLLMERTRLKCRLDQVPEALELFKTIVAKKLDDTERTPIVRVILSEFADAGRPIDAYLVAPNAKEAFEQLASSLSEESRFEELRRLVELHRIKQPKDPNIALYEAELFENEEAWDKAAVVLKAGRKLAAEEKSKIDFRWRYIYAMYKSGRGIQAYEECDNESREAVWNQLTNLICTDKKSADLEALIKAHRPHAKNSEELDYFEARLKIMSKQPAEACTLFQKAISSPSEVWRLNSYRYGFLSAMAAAGYPLEAYHAASDNELTLGIVARELINLKKNKDLESLLNEYGKGKEVDATMSFYFGELNVLRGDFKAAEKHFALAQKSEPENYQYNRRLNWVRVKSGNVLSAYQEAKQESQEFEQLAAICVQEHDANQLQSLIDAHRKVAPNDPNLLEWDLDVLWLKKDYEEVLKRVKAIRAEHSKYQRMRWKYDSYLMRSLVDLKRFDEAIGEAESMAKRRSSNTALIILPHAAAGNVKDTLAAIGKLRGRGSVAESLYQDEDLGPILRSESFRELREKFPEPKRNVERRYDRYDRD